MQQMATLLAGLLVLSLSQSLHADAGPRKARKAYEQAKSDAETLKNNSAKSRQRHNYTKLIKRFDKLEKHNKNNDLANRSCFMAASVAEQLSLASRVPSDLDEAMRRMQLVAKRYPKSRMADDALLAAAHMALERRGDKQGARKFLQELIALGHGDMRPQARELLARLPKAENKTKVKTTAKTKSAKTDTPQQKQTHNLAKTNNTDTAKNHHADDDKHAPEATSKNTQPEEPTDRIAALLHKAELIRTKASADGGSDQLDAQAAVIEAEARVLLVEQQAGQQPAVNKATAATHSSEQTPASYTPKNRNLMSVATEKRLARLKRISTKKLKHGLEVRVQIDREVQNHRGDVPAQPDKNISHRAFIDLDLCKVARGLRPIRPRHSPWLKQVRVGQNTETRARIVFELIGDGEVSGPWPCSGGLCFFVSDAKNMAPAPTRLQVLVQKQQSKSSTAQKNSATSSVDASLAKKNMQLASAKTSSKTKTRQSGHVDAGMLKGGDASRLPKKSSSAGLSLSQQVGLQVKTIVIDPGHGGRDPGAIGPTGLREKDVTLKIAKKLAARLRKDLNIKVIMTRTKDRYVSLEQRARIANDAHADLFISVHINASPNRRAYGMETFYLNTTDDHYAIRLAARENAGSQKSIGDLQFILADLVTKSNVDDSRRLAKTVQRGAMASLRKNYSKIKDLGIKNALFYVLIGVRMPSILFEAAFISNRREEKRLRSKKYLGRLANGMADGVISFVRKQNNSSASRS